MPRIPSRERPPFDPAAGYTVRGRAIAWAMGGEIHHFEDGEEFPVPEDRVGLRRARQLYDDRRLEMRRTPRIERVGKTGWYRVRGADGELLTLKAVRRARAEEIAGAA